MHDDTGSRVAHKRWTVGHTILSLTGISIFAVITVFIAQSHPVVSAWITSSDQLTIPAFVGELLERPYELAGWQLPRSTYLFPDALSYLLARWAVGDSLLAIPIATVPILLTWLYLVWDSVRAKYGGKRLLPLLWTVAVGLMVPLVASQYSTPLTQWVLMYYFSFANHFSCLVVSVLLLRWSIVWLDGGPRKFLVATGLLLTLVAISNRAVWAYYFAPMGATLLWIVANRSRNSPKRPLLLGIVIVSAMVAGYWGEASVNRITAMPYEVSLASIGRRVPRLFSDVFQYAVAMPQSALFLIFVLSVYCLAIRKLWVAFSHRLRPQLGVQGDTRFLFDFALVVGGLGNILAAGIAWEVIDSSRYLMFFFFAPMLLVPRIWIVPPKMGTLVVGLSLLTALSVYSAFASNAALDLRIYAKRQVREMISCVDAIGGGRGIGGYWTARRFTFLSGNELRIDQLTPWKTDAQHLLFYWGNNALSFLRGHPSIDPYTYVVADGLDRSVLENAFGAPDEKLPCGVHEIWRFHDPSHIFPRLFQGNLQPYQRFLARDSFASIPAGIFLAATGSRDGIGRKADPISDSAGFLLYGGYLSLPHGNYRFTLDYTSSDETKPNVKSLGRFEIASDFGKSVLGKVEMTLKPNRSSGSATVDIHLAEAANAIEPRVAYYGTSSLQLSDLSIARDVGGSKIVRLRADDDRVYTLVGVKDGPFVSSNGRAGVLLYGPYISMPGGFYRATVHFSSEPPADAIGKVDIAAKRGEAVFAEKVIAAANALVEEGGYKVEADFELPYPVDDLELRVFLQTPALVKFSHYEIAPR